MKKKKNVAGFTLIELLVVIAIIALLLSILIPGLKRAKDYAKRVICAGRLGQIGVAMKLYTQAYKEFLPSDLDSTGKREMHGHVAYRGEPETRYQKANGTPFPFRFAYLYETGYMDTPELFYCPGNRDETYIYKSYTSPNVWGRFPQDYNTKAGINPWVRIGYTYYPVERNVRIDPATSAPTGPATKYTLLNLNMPYTTDVLLGKSDLSHQFNNIYTVNALFGDAHVSNCNNQAVFNLPIWDDYEAQKGSQAFYDRFCYTIFKLITP